MTTRRASPPARVGPFPAADYTVGYGKPPASGQFRKGRSGNPSGRPAKAKAKPVATVEDSPATRGFGDAAYRVVKPIIDGKETPMTAVEAIQNRRIAVGLKGENRLLMREILSEAIAFEQKDLEDSIARYLRYEAKKLDGYAQLAAAAAAGRSPPVLIPHPDDILLDDEAITVTIEGPTTKAELAQQCFAVAMRDFLAMRWVYVRRFFPPADVQRTSLRLFAELASITDGVLPKRLRWNASLWHAAEPYMKMGVREMDPVLQEQCSILTRHRAAMPEQTKIMDRHIDQLLRWFPRRIVLRKRAQLKAHALNIARLIYADPRVADDLRNPLSKADIPRVLAKVPDLVALLGTSGAYR